mgnify:CR=1 FL=1
MTVVWESALMVLAGLFLLRLAGRKSISQMSLAQTVVMISIGSIIIQPIVESSIWQTILAATVFIVALILMEYLQVRFNVMEKFISGKSKVVIENGELKTENLKKLQFTVDQLEMRLRQQGINHITDVKTATLETNGQLGYELFPDAKPLTVKDFKELMTLYTGIQVQQSNKVQPQNNLFDEPKNHVETEKSPDHLK